VGAHSAVACQSTRAGLPRGVRRDHIHIHIQEGYNTDAIAGVIGYALSPATLLTAVGERKQKRSNAIVSRMHSAMVTRRDARRYVTTRTETICGR